MSTWRSSSTPSGKSQSSSSSSLTTLVGLNDKLDYEEGGEFERGFNSPLHVLGESMEEGRLYSENVTSSHTNYNNNDTNNNDDSQSSKCKLFKDPLLCLGSVPTTLPSLPITTYNDYSDKQVVYETISCNNQPQQQTNNNYAVDPNQQQQQLSQSDWASLISSMNFGQFYDTPFQYILNAATTPCSKINDESLTYLNQGQSYELKLKKLGDAATSDQYLKSIIRIIFHERRLQYMEKEQLETWKQTRPGERILDIDIPLSYGLIDVQIDPDQLSCLHFVWDSQRESSGVYIKLNAISTEFTAKRHGGEKGVPFRIQVETYTIQSANPHHPTTTTTLSSTSEVSPKLIHCASCQVKVFKPKGADRKYKTDKEKIEKKSESEKEKYQPAFDYTVLSEIPVEQVRNYLEQQNNKPSITSMSYDSTSLFSMTSPPPPASKTLNDNLLPNPPLHHQSYSSLSSSLMQQHYNDHSSHSNFNMYEQTSPTNGSHHSFMNQLFISPHHNNNHNVQFDDDNAFVENMDVHCCPPLEHNFQPFPQPYDNRNAILDVSTSTKLLNNNNKPQTALSSAAQPSSLPSSSSSAENNLIRCITETTYLNTGSESSYLPNSQHPLFNGSIASGRSHSASNEVKRVLYGQMNTRICLSPSLSPTSPAHVRSPNTPQPTQNKKTVIIKRKVQDSSSLPSSPDLFLDFSNKNHITLKGNKNSSNNNDNININNNINNNDNININNNINNNDNININNNINNNDSSKGDATNHNNNEHSNDNSNQQPHSRDVFKDQFSNNCRHNLNEIYSENDFAHQSVEDDSVVFHQQRQQQQQQHQHKQQQQNDKQQQLHQHHEQQHQQQQHQNDQHQQSQYQQHKLQQSIATQHISPDNSPFDQNYSHNHVKPAMTSEEVKKWLITNRFENLVQYFEYFSGSDLLRLTREDLIDICGKIDGIRLNNAIHLRPIRPKLTLYVMAVGKLAAKYKADEGVILDINNNIVPSKEIHINDSTGFQILNFTDKENDDKFKGKTKRGREKLQNNKEPNKNSKIYEETKIKRHKYQTDGTQNDVNNAEVYALYFDSITLKNFAQKICSTFNIECQKIKTMFFKAYESMSVVITDQVVINFEDQMKMTVDYKDMHEESLQILQIF